MKAGLLCHVKAPGAKRPLLMGHRKAPSGACPRRGINQKLSDNVFLKTGSQIFHAGLEFTIYPRITLKP